MPLPAEICALAPELGGCHNYVVHWYYNVTNERCERFWYGGCEGNANNFDSEQQCLEFCDNATADRLSEYELVFDDYEDEGIPTTATLQRQCTIVHLNLFW